MLSTKIFLDLGGGIFMLLGALHALYTFTDIGKPRRLVPNDPAVSAAMANCQLRLSGEGTTMWRAWVGFNLSHSIGVILLGVLCVGAGHTLASTAIPAWVLFVLPLVGLMYLIIGVIYWFRIPSIGVAIATGFLILAWLTYVVRGI